MADHVIAATFAPLKTNQEFITPNQVTPYAAAVSDLRKGPVVLEVPAKSDKAVLYGQIVDAWQAALADVGPVGLDEGAGGKYLLLPPGYHEPIPGGYFPIPSSSFYITFAFRSVHAEGATDADANAYTKLLQMYPLSETAAPQPTRFVDALPYPPSYPAVLRHPRPTGHPRHRQRRAGATAWQGNDGHAGHDRD
jgi:hypothetical protein